MERSNNINRSIVIFLICGCIFFVWKNYVVLKELNVKNSLSQLQKNKLERNDEKRNEISCSDVLQELKDIEGMEILNFVEHGKEKITVHVEIKGDKAKILSAFKKVERKENFYSVDNIRMEQDKDKNIKAAADINFIPS